MTQELGQRRKGATWSTNAHAVSLRTAPDSHSSGVLIVAAEGQAVRHLRQAKLIEGRQPRLRVAAEVAAVTGSKADSIRTRAQDDAHYASLILGYLKQYGGASRAEIDDLLRPYLHESLDASQKRNKVTNLLSKMRRTGQIYNVGDRARPRWEPV